MSGLRIISGTAKGIRIQSVPGVTTRPITDRVKESLFNILGGDIVGASFWDLFSGSGSVGIESLSRGASFVCFSDNNYQAIKTIQKNLKISHLVDNYRVIQSDSFSLLSSKPNRKFDYIYIAPPQYKELWKKALLLLEKNLDWLSEDGWVIVQIHPKEYQDLEESGDLINLIEFDTRKYGSTQLVFYKAHSGRIK